MAFTDERLIEICTRYALFEHALEDDGTPLVDADGEEYHVPGLDINTMKVYTAPRSVPVSALKKSTITNSKNIGYWCTVVDGKWELVFDADPSLIDASGIFTEIQE